MYIMIRKLVYIQINKQKKKSFFIFLNVIHHQGESVPLCMHTILHTYIKFYLKFGRDVGVVGLEDILSIKQNQVEDFMFF